MSSVATYRPSRKIRIPWHDWIGLLAPVVLLVIVFINQHVQLSEHVTRIVRLKWAIVQLFALWITLGLVFARNKKLWHTMFAIGWLSLGCGFLSRMLSVYGSHTDMHFVNTWHEFALGAAASFFVVGVPCTVWGFYLFWLQYRKANATQVL